MYLRCVIVRIQSVYETGTKSRILSTHSHFRRLSVVRPPRSKTHFPPSATLLLADLSGLWCCYTFLPCRPLLRFPQNVSAWVSSLMHVCVMCQHFQIPHRPHMHHLTNTTTIHTIHIDTERLQQYHLTDISPTHHRLSQNMKD